MHHLHLIQIIIMTLFCRNTLTTAFLLLAFEGIFPRKRRGTKSDDNDLS